MAYVMLGHSTTQHDHVHHPSSSAPPILTHYCPHPWTWDVDSRSPDAVVVNSTDRRTVLFHPSWSNGTAGIRGTKPLDSDSVYYWEVRRATLSSSLTILLSLVYSATAVTTSELRPNPLKCSGVRWLHFKVFIAIMQV